jgi:hypothetical protein
MKKLIVLLLLISTIANAQMRTAEDYSFKTDKQLHSGAGIVISTGMFLLVNSKTKDPNLAFNAAWMTAATAGLLKEGSDMMSGKEISTADFLYTSLSAVGTALILRQITIIRNKKRAKRNRILKLALSIN